METYNSKIASNDDYQLIHVSRDSDEDSASEWAAKESMPWPILLKEDTDGEKLILPYFPDGSFGVPSYILVDATGKEITRGKSQILGHIDANSKSS